MITATNTQSEFTHLPRKIALVDLTLKKCAVELSGQLDADNFDLITVADQLNGLLMKLQESEPQALILVIEELDDQLLESLESVHQAMPIPVVVFANKHVPKTTKMVMKTGVCSYIVAEIDPIRLPVIVELAISRFQEFHSLEQELQQAKEKLSERKLIDRAKGILMQQKKISEQDAYAQLRKTAMNNGKTMSEISTKVIHAMELLT